MSRSLFCSRRPSKIAVLAEVLGVQSMQRRDVLRGSVLPHPGQGFFRLFGTREPPADHVMRCHASLIVAAHIQGLFRQRPCETMRRRSGLGRRLRRTYLGRGGGVRMTSPERRDPYIVLGVPRQASAAEIARAYRRAARASHPDSGATGSAERFRVVSEAYDELRDPGRRALYDRSHPLARLPTASKPGGSVRYAAPGSQHVVLGEDGRSVPPGGNIDDLAQLALSLLRGRSSGA